MSQDETPELVLPPHSNTCDLVGFRQGYNAPAVCSCGADRKAAPLAPPERGLTRYEMHWDGQPIMVAMGEVTTTHPDDWWCKSTEVAALEAQLQQQGAVKELQRLRKLARCLRIEDAITMATESETMTALRRCELLATSNLRIATLTAQLQQAEAQRTAREQTLLELITEMDAYISTPAIGPLHEAMQEATRNWRRKAALLTASRKE